jgi:GNAT superfamily N-acetyltransferase
METGAQPERTWQVPPAPAAGIALLAHAFAADPLYAWLFGCRSEPAREALLRRFFRALVRGRRLRVQADGERCLVVALDEPWEARPRWTTTLRAAPALLWAMLVGCWSRPWRLVTATRLLVALARLRPKTPHLHLALLAVSPVARGNGLGKAAIVALMRESAGALHLETSRPENREFYARLGLTEVAAVTRGRAPTVWVFRGVGPGPCARA